VVFVPFLGELSRGSWGPAPTPAVAIKKPLSFIVNHNKVAPTKGEVTPKTPGKTALVGR